MSWPHFSSPPAFLKLTPKRPVIGRLPDYCSKEDLYLSLQIAILGLPICPLFSIRISFITHDTFKKMIWSSWWCEILLGDVGGWFDKWSARKLWKMAYSYMWMECPKKCLDTPCWICIQIISRLSHQITVFSMVQLIVRCMPLSLGPRLSASSLQPHHGLF